jgi:Asp-tRNA(Asn)/Glu-tRNA(Gln) amidotransferase A subunit family amidase
LEAPVSESLLRLPISTVLARFRDSSLSPPDYVEAFLGRIAQREPGVKAFKYLEVDGIRGAAAASAARYRAGRPLGPLDGIPVGIKDIIETADMPTGFGSPAFEGTLTGRDAACVAALRTAGAIIAGKTVTTEFAIGFSGITTNPHDPQRTPGGSSSGSAAAVGAGMLPLALGTQTQGSMLRPASYNGAVGFKPTYGALSTGGIHPVAVSHDHLGIFANHVEDAWLTASVISMGAGAAPGYAGLAGAALAAPQPRKPQRLIRLHLKGWDELSAPDRATMNGMVDVLRGQGISIVERNSDARIARLEAVLDRDIDGSMSMLGYEMRYPYTGYVQAHGELIGERIRDIVANSPSISNADYETLLVARAHAQALVTAVLDETRADGFIMPAASGAAPRGLAYTGTRTHLTYWSWLGFPAFSLPLMQAENMPWGLQVMHCARRDADLCALARWLETHIAHPVPH